MCSLSFVQSPASQRGCCENDLFSFVADVTAPGLATALFVALCNHKCLQPEQICRICTTQLNVVQIHGNAHRSEENIPLWAIAASFSYSFVSIFSGER